MLSHICTVWYNGSYDNLFYDLCNETNYCFYIYPRQQLKKIFDLKKRFDPIEFTFIIEKN